MTALDVETSLGEEAEATLARLVAFDTTSHKSNLDLIAWVEGELARLGAHTERVPNADGTKTNLIARIGPDAPGGVALSGHTDVVPVDGQPWTTDPFTLTPKGDRIYGRGTCDMKGFIACALAAAPRFAAADLKRPIVLALSYDEEVGCLGAPTMIERLRVAMPDLRAVIIGEPTDMKVVSAHKGISSFRVRIDGVEAHSSQTKQGASAVMAGARLMGWLMEERDRLKAAAHPASPFDPPQTTLTIGVVHGGTAENILARECVFEWEMRPTPDIDPADVEARFRAAAADVEAEMRAVEDAARVTVERMSNVPPLGPEESGEAETLARRLTGDNATRAVAYAAEGGQFQAGGFSTVVCGPGSIDQAHQPDEFIERAQLALGCQFMERLAQEQAG